MKLPKISPRQQIIIAAIVAAVLLVAFITFLIVPKVIQVGAVGGEEQTALTKLNTAKSTYGQLEELKRSSRKTEYDLLSIERKAPGDAELPALLMQIQDISTKSGTGVLTIKPTTPVQKVDFQQIALEITVDAYFFSLLDFLYRLEKLPRILNVYEITVEEGTAKLPNIKVVVRATAFIMTPGLQPTQSGQSLPTTTSGGATTPTQQTQQTATQAEAAQQQSAQSAAQAAGQ